MSSWSEPEHRQTRQQVQLIYSVLCLAGKKKKKEEEEEEEEETKKKKKKKKKNIYCSSTSLQGSLSYGAQVGKRINNRLIL